MRPSMKPFGVLLLVAVLGVPIVVTADLPDAPDRAEGDGPFTRLVIHGATLIDGTGAPPIGPMTIVVEGNRITDIQSAGTPGLEVGSAPEVGADDKLIDATGMFVLPGLVDTHGHVGAGEQQGSHQEYVFKLWMGHGITTVVDPGAPSGLDKVVRASRRSAANEITAPRLQAYAAIAATTPDEGRAEVAELQSRGATGLKIFQLAPDVQAAVLEAAQARGMRTTQHHTQMGVARMNALDTARLGLTSMQHWYGLPEALFTDRTVQHFPPEFNYSNEQHRFGEAGRLWRQAAPPFSDHWNAVMDELLALDFTLSPTFVAYEATRDLHRARRLEWHEEYTLPAQWRFYEPSRVNHGAFWFEWSTEHELAWRDNYRPWMAFVNEYKNRGGRVTVGSDSGYLYNLFGFGTIREMELLREAGFHPLEVIRSATMYGAEVLGVDDEVGTVEVGKLADLIVLDENPLPNLKTLYGIGAIRLDEHDRAQRVGAVRYTIKDGIVYDARALLADVRRAVREAKDREGFEITQPGKASPSPQITSPSSGVARSNRSSEKASTGSPQR